MNDPYSGRRTIFCAFAFALCHSNYPVVFSSWVITSATLISYFCGDKIFLKSSTIVSNMLRPVGCAPPVTMPQH